MGVDYEHCQDVMKHVSYDVVNINNLPRVKIGDNLYSPEEISSMILAKMKSSAEEYLGEKIEDAVITCPAWFDNAAREATKLAGEMAGLKVHRIINEPTAAILASDINTDESKIILVADIGCGTVDFSVCEISSGVVEVLASKGDVFLGGSDFDNAIANYLINQLKNEQNVDISNDLQAKQRVIDASEAAKIDLSSCLSTDINLPYITLKDGLPVHLSTTLSRATMEHITHQLVDRIINCAHESIEAAKIDKKDISCILMVGGQSRSIDIRNRLKAEICDNLNLSVNPDEAVALGAAVQADIIVGGETSNDILLLDVTPISIGIETMGGIMTKLIEANTTIPCSKSEIFSTTSDNQSVVDIKVLQGERPMAKDNKEIGIFRLDGIQQAPRGVPRIEVKFDIDANGILQVSATDLDTNVSQTVTIQSNKTLTQSEIERIKKEAEKFAESDRKLKEDAEVINKVDTFKFSISKLLSEQKSKISQDEEEYLNHLVEELDKGIKNKDIEHINNIYNSNSQKVYEIINTVSRQAQ